VELGINNKVEFYIKISLKEDKKAVFCFVINTKEVKKVKHSLQIDLIKMRLKFATK